MYIHIFVGTYIWGMCKHFSMGDLESTAVNSEEQEKDFGQRSGIIKTAFWKYPLILGNHYPGKGFLKMQF